MLAHLARAGCAVEPEHVGLERAERGERGADLGSEEHEACGLDGDLHLDRDLAADRSHRLAGPDDRGLGLQQVLHRLDDQEVGAALQQAVRQRLVGVAQLGEPDPTKCDHLGAGAHRARHPLVRPVAARDLPGDLGRLHGELVGALGNAVLDEHGGEPTEAVRLDHVDTDREERVVEVVDDVGPGVVEDLGAALELGTAVVVDAQVTLVEARAGGAVEDHDALTYGVQEAAHVTQGYWRRVIGKVDSAAGRRRAEGDVMRRVAAVVLVVVALAAGGSLIGVPPAAAAANIEFCSIGGGRSAREFPTHLQYSRFRAALLDPANFGPAGTIDRSVTIRPAIAVIDAAGLAGCDIFFFNEVAAAPSAAELTALMTAVNAGMKLIADGDSSIPNGLNAVLGAMGGGRAASGAASCGNGATDGSISAVDDVATNGPFGDVRGGTFATSPSLVVTPAASDDTLVTCTGIVRILVPAGALSASSGAVMAGGDPSASDFFFPGGAFANANNKTMYLNFVASGSAPAPTTTDLTLSKSCPTAALPGEQINCSITVNNTGTVDAQAVSVSDDLPANETLVGTPSGGGFTCGTGDPFVCTWPVLPAGATAIITYTVRLSDDTPSGSSLTNSASVTTTTPETSTANNSGSATTSLPACTINFSTATTGQTIRGTAGADVICGSPYADTIQALDGADVVFGNGGGDTVQGNGGDDKMFGGPGDDTITGPPGNDAANGGTGFDRCVSKSNTACEQVQVA